MKRLRYLALLALPVALSACDQLGIETPAVTAARAEAEGKAIGGACRHAGRALEDCYSLNKKAAKAAVYAGWREMDGYMRENKIDVVPPADESAAKSAKPEAAGDAAADKEKAADKADKADKVDKADKTDKEKAAKATEGGAAEAASDNKAEGGAKSSAKPKREEAKPRKTSFARPGAIQA